MCIYTVRALRMRLGSIIASSQTLESLSSSLCSEVVYYYISLRLRFFIFTMFALRVFVLAAAFFLATPVVADLRFNVTAVGAQHGKSTIECWEVKTSFDISEDTATRGSSVAQLGDVSSISLSYAWPGDEPEAHNAPANQ